jgi:hypothetical protein
MGHALVASWQVLTSKLGEIERKYGLADKGKVREEAIFEMYKQHIHQLRNQVGGAGDRSCLLLCWLLRC